MLFSMVHITPRYSENHDEWSVTFADLPYQRINEGHHPHNNGVYYYPRRMGQKKAFNILHAHLVAQHEIEITSLMTSLEKLKKLKFSEPKEPMKELL